MSANDKQVGGEHYKSSIQHWDYVVANDLDYFQAQITKYITRWKKKNGFQDLLKARHFLEKYIELEGQKPKFDLSDLALEKAANDIQSLEKDRAKKVVPRCLPDYQEQLSKDVEKMRSDAMVGVEDDSALPPILKTWLSSEEPQSKGYVNQDYPVAKDFGLL